MQIVRFAYLWVATWQPHLCISNGLSNGSEGCELHERWWKFIRSYSQVILLNWSLIYEARLLSWLLSYIHFESGNFTIFPSMERQYDWNIVYVCGKAQRLPCASFPISCWWREGQQHKDHMICNKRVKRGTLLFFCSTLLCQLMSCALHVIDFILI